MTTPPKVKKRFWVFTINNYTSDVVDIIKNITCRAVVAGKEKGEHGTPHIQGAIYFNTPRTRKSVCKKLGGKAYVAVAHGTWKDQVKYCTKDGDVIRNEGEGPQQGARTDLEDFKNNVLTGTDEMDLWNGDCVNMAKYPRMYGRLKFMADKQSTKDFRKLDVEVRWGKAGTGKSRGPREEGAFNVHLGDTEWWDGYDGEKAVLFDDFYGQLKYSRMLQLLDGYQLMLPIKGGFTYAKYTKVYITSNKPPDEWYSGVDDTSALMRRITNIIEFN